MTSELSALAMPLSVMVASLCDKSPEPAFPRWCGYTNGWLALTLLPDQRSIQLRTEPEPGVEVEKVSPLANIITVTNKDDYLLVPTREGLLIPADSGLRFNHRFETYAYEGCHMAMMGAVQESAALLATWDDPLAWWTRLVEMSQPR